MLPIRFASFDLLELGVLDVRLIGDINKRSIEYAEPAQLTGGVGTSHEPSGTSLHYRLLNGVQVATHIPELERLYREDFLELAEKAFGVRMMISPEQRSGVNVNVLDSIGSRYEWHVDSNTLTGLLVLDNWSKASGGRLLFGRDEDTQIALSLRKGQFLLFDARERPHSVEPLRSNNTRVTAPMNFYEDGGPVVRPAGLDEVLYEEPES